MKTITPYITNVKYFLLMFIISISYSCSEDLPGCTDPTSSSFNADATSDDGSCFYLRDQYIGIYEGFFDASDDRFDMQNFGVRIQRSIDGEDIVSIGFTCCPSIKYKGTVSENKIEIDDFNEVTGFPGCDGTTGFNGTPFDGIVGWKGTWNFDQDLNISFTDLIERYVDSDGQVLCNTSYMATLIRQ